MLPRDPNLPLPLDPDSDERYPEIPPIRHRRWVAYVVAALLFLFVLAALSWVLAPLFFSWSAS